MKSFKVVSYFLFQIQIIFLTLFLGCAKKIEPHNISYSDLKEVAYQGAKSFLEEYQSLEEYQANEKKILVISDFSNFTDQDIDVELLSRVLAREIRKSKKINLTNTISGNAIKTDDMVYGARGLRNDKEFDAKTLTQEGNLIAPDFSLSGKITQKATPINKSLTRIDYVFLLTLTDIKTGLVVWDKDVIISRVVQPSQEMAKLQLKEKQPQNQEQDTQEVNVEQPQDMAQQNEVTKKSAFFIGMDGGVSFNQEADDDDLKNRFPYAFRIRGGYIHRLKPDLSVSLQVIYEALKMQERNYVNSYRKGKDEDDENFSYQDKIHHQFGIGTMLQYKFLYLGGGMLYDFDKAMKVSQNFHPFLESGIFVTTNRIGVNLGVRYAFAINNPSYKNFGLATFLGIIFMF